MNILDSFWHLDIKIECLHSEGFVGHASCIERHKTLDIRFSMGKVRGSGGQAMLTSVSRRLKEHLLGGK